MSKNNVPIERAVGTARLARDFSEAAINYEPPDDRISLVTYFLAGHALELAFKAVLIVEGVTEKRLRRSLGHDLQSYYRAALEVMPDGLLDDLRVGSVVEMIAGHYGAKAFEYVIPGPARLPLPVPMTETVDTVVGRLRTWVEASVRRELLRNRGGSAAD